MFFVLSKLLTFLIQPLNWVMAFLVIGLLRRKTRWGKRLLVAGVVMAVFFTNPLVLNWVTRAWELNPVTIASIEEPYDVGIVLGGFSSVSKEFPDRIHLTEHPNRFIHVIELYKAGKVRKILLSGGSSAIIGEKRTDAGNLRRFLLDAGLPPEDVLVEARSRNTHENAVYSAALLADEMPGALCLLVTSASHMRRASACFRKEGVEVTPFVTDWTADAIDYPTPGALVLPDARGFVRWGMLLKEWAGTAVYRLKGWV